MEDELQKRNTDCVYFLASPLTCKKGIDCEYRHSEVARLNPRDCWYWISGNCLNPACAFRHPPLDGHNELSSDSADIPLQKYPLPMTKTDVPCYFFFNGFCSKGNHCSFSHGLDNIITLKHLKTTSAVPDVLGTKVSSDALDKKVSGGPDALSLSNRPFAVSHKPSAVSDALLFNKKPSAVFDALPLHKTSAVNDMKPLPIEAYTNFSGPSARSSLLHQIQPNELPRKPVSAEVVNEVAPLQMPESKFEEAAISRSEPLMLPAEGFFHSTSLVCSDQSSDDDIDDQIEAEERWQSSPGFDVLVEGRADDIRYEDDPDYALAVDREGRELNSHFLGYEFEHRVEFEPQHLEADISCGPSRYDSYHCVDYDHDPDYGRFVPCHSRERMCDPVSFQKRKLLPLRYRENRQNRLDLRDHLRERRSLECSSINYFSRRHSPSRLIDRTRERSRRPSSRWQLPRRLTSEVGVNMIGSVTEEIAHLNGFNRQNRSRHTMVHKPRHRLEVRKHCFEKRRHIKKKRLSSEVGKPDQESISFTGPKTLERIREERKFKGTEAFLGVVEHESSNVVGGFQGPKPLNEILKEKRKIGTEVDGGTSKLKNDCVL